MTKKEKLDAMENELAALARNEAASWKKAYAIMREVENTRMWQEGGHSSFAAWVRHVSASKGVTEDSLWKAKAAGDRYSEYEAAMRAKGLRCATLEQSGIAQATITYVARMSQGDSDKFAALTRYVEKHAVPKTVAREAWRVTRRKLEEASMEATKKSRHGSWSGGTPAIDPLAILAETAYPKADDGCLTDAEIARLVRKKLGARIHRSTLERILDLAANYD